MDIYKSDSSCSEEGCEIDTHDLAPELVVNEWLNTDRQDIKLSDFKGKVVLIEVFQMLCPACVTHSLPQAERLHNQFRGQDKLSVLGLHSVFEHHKAMGKESLQAMLSEFRYGFPVAIDKHLDGEILPETMKKYNLKGTPSLILIDQTGKVSETIFGAMDDLVLGVKIGRLLK